jgi:hypothetical protein
VAARLRSLLASRFAISAAAISSTVFNKVRHLAESLDMDAHDEIWQG